MTPWLLQRRFTIERPEPPDAVRARLQALPTTSEALHLMLSPLPQDRSIVEAPAAATTSASASAAAPAYATDRESVRYWLLGWVERNRIIHVTQSPDWVMERLRIGRSFPHVRKPPRGPQPKPVGFGRDVKWTGCLDEETFWLVQPSTRARGVQTILAGRVTAAPAGGSVIRVRIQPRWVEALWAPIVMVTILWLYGRQRPDLRTAVPFLAAFILAAYLFSGWFDARLTERELRRVLGLR